MRKYMAELACVECGKIERISVRARRLCLACRIASSVEKTETCWTWTGAKSSVGYGMLSVNGVPVLAHRVIYEMQHGPIPFGVEVDHVCRNRGCVNPDHLRLADRSQNAQNMAGARVDSKSGFRGVSKLKGTSRWAAEVHYRGKRYRSSHATAEEANEAAVALRNRLFSHNDVDRIT